MRDPASSSVVSGPVTAGVLALVVTALLFGWWIRGREAIDFLSFHSAGHALIHGQLDRVYDRSYLRSVQSEWIDPGRSGVYPYYYPPAFALLFAPLAVVPMTVARLVWGSVDLVLIVWAVAACRRWSGLAWPGSVYLLLALPPLYIALALLHVTPLLLLAGALAARAVWGSRERFRDGVVAGILWMKPQLLVPLVVLWIARRRFGALAGLATAATSVLLLSAMLSPAALSAYLTSLPAASRAGLAGLEARGVNVTMYSTFREILPDPAALAAFAAVGVGVLAVLLAAWGRAASIGPHHHALLWLAPLLLTPYLGAYDLLLLYIPLTFLAPVMGKDRPLAAAVIVLGLFLFGMAASRGPHVAMVPWCTLALYGVCGWRAIGGEPDATSERGP